MIFYKTLDAEISGLLVRVAAEASAFGHEDIATLAKQALSDYAGAQAIQSQAETKLIVSARELIAILSSGRNWVEDAKSYSYFDAHEYREQFELLLNRLSKPMEYRRVLEDVLKELDVILRRAHVLNPQMTVVQQDFESSAYWGLRTESLEVSANSVLDIFRRLNAEASDEEYPAGLSDELDKLLERLEVASLLAELHIDDKAVKA